MKSIRQILLTVLLAIIGGTATAQEVTALFFLENTPMRHLYNPAIQPVSRGYFSLLPVGYSSVWAGNNSLTISDLIFVAPTTGKTITALHPNADRSKLMKAFQKSTLINTEMTLNLFSFGFRCKEDRGYFHFTVIEHIDAGVGLPKSMFNFLLNGGMTDLNGVNTMDLSALSVGANIYTDLGFGYSSKIGEKVTLGGRIKILLGTAYVGLDATGLQLTASAEKWQLKGQPTIAVAGPLQFDKLPKQLYTEGFDYSQLIDTKHVLDLLKPSGFGLGLDFGFTYKPIKQLQVAASVTDLGFIFWNNSRKIETDINAEFDGAGDFNLSDLRANGQFSADTIMAAMGDKMKTILEGITLGEMTPSFLRMPTAKFNVSLDANFWNNRVGVGLISRTKLTNARLYEDITLGASFRPFNWINLALSYSLLQNGKYSNIGAGLSIMPGDGINITLATDYIPTSYAPLTNEDGKQTFALPYKTKGLNVALGVSFVWGTNKKKAKVDDQPEIAKATEKKEKTSKREARKAKKDDSEYIHY